MDIHIKLLYILDKLVDCIEGPWFISDGALLGITREGGLITHDDDIDLYLLPGTTIDYNQLEKANLKSQQYYMNEKIYSPLFDKQKSSNSNNAWSHYCSFVKVANRHLAKDGVLKLASQSYKTQKKEINYSYPNIDIFYLYKHNDKYFTEHWEDFMHYEPDEVDTLTLYDLYDIPVFLPANVENILERQYGKNWKIPDKNFQYF